MTLRRCWAPFLCVFFPLACDSAVEPNPNPVPILQSVEPEVLTQEETPAALTLTGLAFVEGAEAFWNGSARPTTYASPTSLTVALTPADLDEVGEVAVSASNPEPGGGTSESLTVTVGHPAPRVESLSPTSAEAVFTSELTLHVHGSRFAAGPDGAVARWNGIPLPTTVVTSTELRAEVADYLLRKGESVQVTVSNPPPGGGISAPLIFGTENPVPELTASRPTGVLVGTDVSLSLSGSGFVGGAGVWYGDVRVEPGSVSEDAIGVWIPGELNVHGTVIPVRVENPGPGGGFSEHIEIPVRDYPPRIDVLSPTSTFAGSPSFTLGILGADFSPYATVTWDGMIRPATVVNESRIEVPVDVSDVETAKTVEIKVANPTNDTEAFAELEILPPAPPQISALSPPSAIAGSPAFTLTINGSAFAAAASVAWNGVARSAKVVSAETIEVPVDAADVDEVGTAEIVVQNPDVDGEASVEFHILPPPPPEIDAFSPPWVFAGSSSFTLTILGSSFPEDAIVTWNDQVRPAVIVSQERIELQVDAVDVAAEGTIEVVVANPWTGREASAQFVILPESLPFGSDIASATWGGGEIVASSIDGAERTALAVPGGAFRVDASPVSRLVTFHGRGNGHEFRIFVADPFTGAIWRLTGPNVEALISQEQWARFSADGRSIYFMGSRRTNGGWELWKANVDGSEAQRLEQEPRAFNGYPAPSHAGDRLVYSASASKSPGSNGSLEVLDLNTGQASSLGVLGGTSRWSPQDDWIAYVNGSWQLRLIRPDGTEDHELVPGAVFESGFDWSPDGKFIIATDRDGNAVLVTVESGGIPPLPGLGRIDSVAWYGP